MAPLSEAPSAAASPAGPAADYEHVAMSENVAVLIRVGLAWRAPEPGGAPDQRLVKALPGMWPKPLRAA